MTCTVTYPMRTRNPANSSQGMTRGAMFAKARQRKAERAASYLHVLSLRPLPELPVVVTLTRIAPSSGLDCDNLRSAFKSVRDSVADALGLKNDRDAKVTWDYGQE